MASKRIASSDLEKDIDVGRNSPHVFGYLLQGLIRDKWSGTITVNTSDWKKRIFINKGQFSFATSTLLDDRLGECMYRRGLISLDNLAAAAVNVTPEIKFGQLLLRDNILNNVGLWQALKVQVICIIKSLFLNERISYLIQKGEPLLPNYITIDDSYDLIDRFRIFNLIFLKFRRSLAPSTFLTVSPHKFGNIDRGDFYGDLLSLIANNKNIQDVLKSSKVCEDYALVAIMELLALNACSLNFDFSGDAVMTDVALQPVKTAADNYRILLGQAVEKFKAHGCESALKEVCQFSRTLSHSELNILVLDMDGEISGNSLTRISDHCTLDPTQIQTYVSKIATLTRFLLQTSIDLLPVEATKKITTTYEELARV